MFCQRKQQYITPGTSPKLRRLILTKIDARRSKKLVNYENTQKALNRNIFTFKYI
jgi:hypothetical protein